MATLRTYDALTDLLAPLVRYRFNEDSGPTAFDSADGLDGEYEPGSAPGAAGFIGDGAATFDGSTGFVLVTTTSGTLRVSAFGDSEIGGDGLQLPPDQYSPVLEGRIDGLGIDATVINRGVSGERSDQGLLRVADVIADDPDVVILEFGTNDALQQANTPAEVEANLRAIIAELQAGGVPQILITGTFGVFPDFGGGYQTAEVRDEFEAIFAEIAADTAGVTLLQNLDGTDKFLLGERVPGATPAEDTIEGGVLGDPALQAGGPAAPDGLHPNADGIQLMVTSHLPQVVALGGAAGAVSEPLQLANGSFEVWFIANEVTEGTLFAKNSAGQGTGGQIAAWIREGQAFAAIGSLEDNAFVQGGTILPGVMTHYVLTFGEGGMQLFVDGELVGSNASFTEGLDNGLGNYEPLVIGVETSESTPGGVLDNLRAHFDGVIDEFNIYDRALDTTEVADLFAAGVAAPELVGTNQADVLIGGADDDTIRGQKGADEITGAGGADELRGGAGRDSVTGGDGDDQMFGGDGVDDVSGDAGDDKLTGGPGEDTVSGGAGNDDVRGGRGPDDIFGGDGDDVMDGRQGRDNVSGDAGNDQLTGGDGIDTLIGGIGDDDLRGNAGDDILDGGDGNDVFKGGPGRDQLTGGAGVDVFRMTKLTDGVDEVLDFLEGPGGDVLDLSAVVDFQDGDAVSDFFQLNAVAGGVEAAVDRDGAGGDKGFVTVFDLVGVSTFDANEFAADGNVQLS